MSLLTGLTAHFKLDEASGNALDAHSTNNLTVNNGVGSSTGKINGARSFVRGSNQFFNRTSNSSFSIPNTSTSYHISGWMQISINTETKQIVTKRINQQVGPGLEYMLRVDSTTPILYWGVGGFSFGSLSSGVTMSVDVWYFFEFGYDASTNRFFISINRAAYTYSSSITSQTINGTNEVGVGGNTILEANEQHSGLIDAVGWRIGYLPTSDEANQLYNGGSGLDYPFSVTTVGVGLYDEDSFGAGITTSSINSSGTGFADDDNFGTGLITSSLASDGVGFYDPDSFGIGLTYVNQESVGVGLYDEDHFGTGRVVLVSVHELGTVALSTLKTGTIGLSMLQTASIELSMHLPGDVNGF